MYPNEYKEHFDIRRRYAIKVVEKIPLDGRRCGVETSQHIEWLLDKEKDLEMEGGGREEGALGQCPKGEQWKEGLLNQEKRERQSVNL